MLKSPSIARRFLGAVALSVMATAGLAQTAPSQLNVTGVTVYDPAEILGYAAHVVAVRHGAVRPADAAEVLEIIYREDGYFLAEVFLADDGETLVVDEGHIGSVTIEGTDAGTYAMVRRYMEPLVGRRAVRQQDFERAMMLVEDLGTVTATAQIDFPPDSYEAHVRVVAEPTDTSWGSVSLDNPARQFGEAANLSFSQTVLGALATGDLFRIEGTVSGDFGLNATSFHGAVTYRLPIGGNGTYAEFYGGNIVAHRDASGTLLATDIDGWTGVAAIGHPFVRSLDSYGYGLLDFRHSGNAVDVSGTKFRSAVNVLGASWIYGRALPEGGAFEYAVNLSFGDRTTAIAGLDDGDASFTYVRAGVGFERPVSWFGPDSTFSVDIWGQYSPDRLPGIEEFYIGGRDAERGYAFSEDKGDSGLSVTLEAGRDVYPGSGFASRLKPFGFLDLGYVVNNAPSATENRRTFLASAGVGLEAAFVHDISMRGHIGVPLVDGPSTRAGDVSVYLNVTRSW